jgi:hypothetical protein
MIQERIAELEKILEQQQRATSAPPQGPEPPTRNQSAEQTSTAAPPQAAAAVTAAPPALSEKRPFYKNAPAMTLAIGGVALVGVGGALIGVALKDGASARNAATQAEFDSYHRSDLTHQKAGWPILAIGAASLATGSLLFALNAKHR